MDKLAFKQGDFLIDNSIQATINNKIKVFKPTKIAILIGSGTASSGERVTLVFRQRNNTKLFGENSAGLQFYKWFYIQQQ